MQIKPFDRTIKEVLEGGFYRIPRFQRPYSWDSEQVDDLWSDAIANDDPDYFIGSFVLHRPNNQTDIFSVVDGQQRLTTITLILAALRNALNTLGHKSFADGIQNLIERENINNEKFFVLQTETSYPYLQEYIQKSGQPELAPSSGAEEDALKNAFEYLSSKLTQSIASVDADPSIPNARKAADKEKKLKRLRDNVLRLQLIVVELTNEDDAYVIFETLNTRGKDLGIADLLKNHLTRHLKPKNKNVDVAKDKWSKIRELFDASAADIDINAFIYHAWLSRYPYVGKEKLFRELKRRVDKQTAMQYLDDLLTDAEIYRHIAEPSSYKWSKQEAEVRASLDALNIFRVVQPVPMTISILRDYRDKKLSLAQTRKILRDMENFHVQFTAVTAQRTGGGTARMYALSAEQLSHASDANARGSTLVEFRKKMRERIPLYGEFEANFLEIEFSSASTKQKGLVQYLLRRFHEATWDGPPVDYAKMTIEHIAPENPQGPSLIANLGKLGNLLLLPQPANSDLGNMSFAAKKAAYKQAGVKLDAVLAKATNWTDAEIAKRTKTLARIAFDQVFKV